MTPDMGPTHTAYLLRDAASTLVVDGVADSERTAVVRDAAQRLVDTLNELGAEGLTVDLCAGALCVSQGTGYANIVPDDFPGVHWKVEG